MSKKLTITHLYWLWLVSLVSFVAAIFVVRRTPESFSSASLIVFALIVIFGAVSYLALIVNVLKQIRSRKARIMGMVSIVTFVCFFGLLFNFENVEAKLGFSEKVQPMLNTVTTQPKLGNSPTPAPSQIPKANSGAVKKITCTGPDGKTFQTTQEECTAFNAAWGNAPKPETMNNGQQVNFPCHLSHGTYNLTPEQCAQAQQSNSGSYNYTYTVPPLPDTSLGNGYTSSGNSYTTSSNNTELQQACISDAMRAAEQDLQKTLSILRAQGLSGSAVERAEKDALARVERETRQCILRYPTN